jgi:arylsulfatase
MIAFWPKGIKLPKGSISQALGHVMDFMPTFIELANAKYPSVYKGHNIKPFHGKSLLPAFTSASATGHDILFNEHFGARYVRWNGWKLVSRKNEKAKLFRMSDDETELNDLSSKHPDIVQNLELQWDEWSRKNNVVPKQKLK